MPGNDSLDNLLTILRSEGSDELDRARAVADIEAYPIAAVIDLLKSILQGDRHPKVRANAATVLGHIRSKVSVPSLIAALETGQDPEVRELSASALGRIGDATGIPALIAALEQDTDGDTRERSAEALAK